MKLNNYDYVSAWVALADSTIENGCLRVIPGSHKQLYEHYLDPVEHNLLKRSTTVDVSDMEDKILDVELKAGQMSLHHVNTIHG
jgi:non-heme Fe2+,alpha-ketoglutarate-dependent halogenase